MSEPKSNPLDSLLEILESKKDTMPDGTYRALIEEIGRVRGKVPSVREATVSRWVEVITKMGIDVDIPKLRFFDMEGRNLVGGDCYPTCFLEDTNYEMKIGDVVLYNGSKKSNPTIATETIRTITMRMLVTIPSSEKGGCHRETQIIVSSTGETVYLRSYIMSILSPFGGFIDGESIVSCKFINPPLHMLMTAEDERKYRESYERLQSESDSSDEE